jgi:hypothetical protein
MLFDRDFSHVNNMLISFPYQICNGGRNCQDYIPDIYHHVIFHVTFDYFDTYNIYFFQINCNVMLLIFLYCFSWSAPILERSRSDKLRYLLVPHCSHESDYEQCFTIYIFYWLNYLFNLIFRFNLVLNFKKCQFNPLS